MYIILDSHDTLLMLIAIEWKCSEYKQLHLMEVICRDVLPKKSRDVQP